MLHTGTHTQDAREGLQRVLELAEQHEGDAAGHEQQDVRDDGRSELPVQVGSLEGGGRSGSEHSSLPALPLSQPYHECASVGLAERGGVHITGHVDLQVGCGWGDVSVLTHTHTPRRALSACLHVVAILVCLL